MATFRAEFTVLGGDQAQLPVTLLDDVILKLVGLEAKTFRFTVQNILDREVVLPITIVLPDAALGKITIVTDVSTLTLAVAETATITATITALVPLTEQDLFNIQINGSEVV